MTDWNAFRSQASATNVIENCFRFNEAIDQTRIPSLARRAGNGKIASNQTLSMDGRRLTQNPYDPPTAEVVVSRTCKSRRAYWVASALVLGLFVIAAAVCMWITSPTIEDGDVWFDIPGGIVSASPSGDPVITYDRMISMSVGTAIAQVAVLNGASLAIVNGALFLWRRNGRQA